MFIDALSLQKIMYNFVYIGGVLMYKPQQMYPTQYYKI